MSQKDSAGVKAFALHSVNPDLIPSTAHRPQHHWKQSPSTELRLASENRWLSRIFFLSVFICWISKTIEMCHLSVLKARILSSRCEARTSPWLASFLAWSSHYLCEHIFLYAVKTHPKDISFSSGFFRPCLQILLLFLVGWLWLGGIHSSAQDLLLDHFWQGLGCQVLNSSWPYKTGALSTILSL